MLRPSYSDLLNVLNKEDDKDNIIQSRYTIVIATAKRARQLVDHATPLSVNCKVNKPVSIAVNELYENKIKIRPNPEEETDQTADTAQEDTGNAQTSDAMDNLA